MARAMQAQERTIQEKQEEIEILLYEKSLAEHQLAVQADGLITERMSRRNFRDHLNAHGVLIPGSDGRTMQNGWQQVQQHGPDCHVCRLCGHWRGVCPHGPC